MFKRSIRRIGIRAINTVAAICIFSCVEQIEQSVIVEYVRTHIAFSRIFARLMRKDDIARHPMYQIGRGVDAEHIVSVGNAVIEVVCSLIEQYIRIRTGVYRIRVGIACFSDTIRDGRTLSSPLN